MTAIPEAGLAWPFGPPADEVMVYEQPMPPENPEIGDIWLDTADIHLLKISDTHLKVLGPPNSKIIIAWGAASVSDGGADGWSGNRRTDASGVLHYINPYEAGWYTAVLSVNDQEVARSPETIQVAGAFANWFEGMNTDYVACQTDNGASPGQCLWIESMSDYPYLEYGPWYNATNPTMETLEGIQPINVNNWGAPIGFVASGPIKSSIQMTDPTANLFLVAARPVAGQPWPQETLLLPAPIVEQTIDVTQYSTTHYGLAMKPGPGNSWPDVSPGGTAVFVNAYADSVAIENVDAVVTIEQIPAPKYVKFSVKTSAGVPIPNRLLMIEDYSPYGLSNSYYWTLLLDDQGEAYWTDYFTYAPTAEPDDGQQVRGFGTVPSEVFTYRRAAP